VLTASDVIVASPVLHQTSYTDDCQEYDILYFLNLIFQCNHSLKTDSYVVYIVHKLLHWNSLFY